MCIGPMFQLMTDGPDAQLAFQRAEHTLDLGQLHVARPQHRGIFAGEVAAQQIVAVTDRKSTRLNSSHLGISYAVFCLKKKSTGQIAFRLMLPRSSCVGSAAEACYP